MSTTVFHPPQDVFGTFPKNIKISNLTDTNVRDIYLPFFNEDSTQTLHTFTTNPANPENDDTNDGYDGKSRTTQF